MAAHRIYVLVSDARTLVSEPDGHGILALEYYPSCFLYGLAHIVRVLEVDGACLRRHLAGDGLVGQVERFASGVASLANTVPGCLAE